MSVKNFSTAEELEATKAKNNQNRIRKLTQDRQEKNGKLAQTDGLKTITQSRRNTNNFVFTDDDETEIIDLKRVRKLSDVETENS